MANIKELKKRIKSTKSTLKITSAMKLVSASKMAKAQAKIQGFKPYSRELEITVKTCAALAEDYTNIFMSTNESVKILVLVVSSDRGLCGGYNSQLYKKVRNYVLEYGKENVDIRYVGKKVHQLLAKDSSLNHGKTYKFEKADPTFSEVKELACELSGEFTEGLYSKVFVAYNSFLTAISFQPTVHQVLPISVTDKEKEELAQKFPVDFKYEPSAKEILDELVPQVYTTTVYTCFLDAAASEHAARMAAMESASKNSKEMIRKLTLKTNKLRQAAITTELSEVVSGAESLNS